jgi:hypothetical protein
MWCGFSLTYFPDYNTEALHIFICYCGICILARIVRNPVGCGLRFLVSEGLHLNFNVPSAHFMNVNFHETVSACLLVELE